MSGKTKHKGNHPSTRQGAPSAHKFRIFILGAGFSRAAGLPLADELWAEVRRRAKYMTGRASFFTDDLHAYIEFRKECYGETCTPATVDFEDFMAFLDIEHYLGLRGSDTWSRDGNEAQVVVKTLIGEILTECTPSKENLPTLYLEFARTLRPHDIVLTFNYVIHVKETAPSPAPGQLLTEEGLGSGVLIDTAGKVLTAAHVVQVADEVSVEFPNGEIINAKVVASAPRADISLLQLDRPPSQPVAVPLGDSDRVEVGDQIFVVGAPLGISHTLTVGHISAKRRAASLYGGFSPAILLQTDAAINPGNSGGPMFNMEGEVVGIVSHMLSRTGGYEGLGFVVASNTVRQLLLDTPTLWTGIDGYLLEPAMARLFNLPIQGGLLVQRVAEGSPASKMGLRGGTVSATIAGEELLLGGDIIFAVDGIVLEPANFPRIQERLKQTTPGRRITVTVFRGGERMVLTSEPLP